MSTLQQEKTEALAHLSPGYRVAAGATTRSPGIEMVSRHRSITRFACGVKEVPFHDAASTVGRGDRCGLGGGGSSLAEGDASPEQWAQGIDWISEPAPSCLTDTRWSVDDVEKISNN